jgi:hypothetical protein
MTDFTLIRWGGEDCILITTTDYNNTKLPILILTRYDIQRLKDEWEGRE